MRQGPLQLATLFSEPAEGAMSRLGIKRTSRSPVIMVAKDQKRTLTGELSAPIRAGIGIHAGLAVVGWMSVGASQSLQFPRAAARLRRVRASGGGDRCALTRFKTAHTGGLGVLA
jgi:hypothetical protein